MDTRQNNSLHWSRHEWDLINVTDIFKHKPAILKKAESYLEELRSALAAEIKAHPKSYPPETDLTKGQIARGENHKGFPFLSLDIPQKFSKTEFFTYRTLFWWGHYLGFSLILKGPGLNNYVNRLQQFRKDPAGKNVYLSLHASPWEWGLEDDKFVKVSDYPPEKIQETADRLQYLKLMRCFPVSEEAFTKLHWAREGTQTFRDLIHLVLT